jgi:hypothetical protein
VLGDDLTREPSFGPRGIAKRAPGSQLGILRCCELSKSLSRNLPVRLVLKRHVHVHHERVRLRRVFDQVGARFRSEPDGFECHRRNSAVDLFGVRGGATVGGQIRAASASLST